MSKKIKSAEEIQAIINAQILASGLDPFLFGQSALCGCSIATGSGRTGKLQGQLPAGDVRQVSAAARIIKEALANYSLSD